MRDLLGRLANKDGIMPPRTEGGVVVAGVIGVCVLGWFIAGFFV